MNEFTDTTITGDLTVTGTITGDAIDAADLTLDSQIGRAHV